MVNQVVSEGKVRAAISLNKIVRVFYTTMLSRGDSFMDTAICLPKPFVQLGTGFLEAVMFLSLKPS
jgi:hypothetical protein